MAFSRTHSLLARAGSTSTYKRVWRYWYPLMTRGLGNDEIVFINWAYEEDPPMDLPLEASDEPNRAHINLYHRTATQVDLGGKQVLEVSCGHGGGASYLTRTLHPASYTGLDLNQAGIKLCKKRHRLPGLDFVRGDAENLPFDDESFDVVLNVEASHCYPHFRRFLAEVVRVLRPGRYFPYADLRPNNEIAAWEADLAATTVAAANQRRSAARHRKQFTEVTGPGRPPFAGLPAFRGPRIHRCAGHAAVPLPGRRGTLVPDVLLHQGLSQFRVMSPG